MYKLPQNFKLCQSSMISDIVCHFLGFPIYLAWPSIFDILLLDSSKASLFDFIELYLVMALSNLVYLFLVFVAMTGALCLEDTPSPILSTIQRQRRVFDDGAPLNWRGLSSEVGSFVQKVGNDVLAQNAQMVNRFDQIIAAAKATGNWVCAIEIEFGQRKSVCRAIDPVTQKALITQSELLGDPTQHSSIF